MDCHPWTLDSVVPDGMTVDFLIVPTLRRGNGMLAALRSHAGIELQRGALNNRFPRRNVGTIQKTFAPYLNWLQLIQEKINV